MGIFNQHSLSLVFKRTADSQYDEITDSMKMNHVLPALDGRRPLARIIQLLKMPGHEVLVCIQRLYDLGLITFGNTLLSPSSTSRR